jgi:hypothetical protein
MRALVLVTFLAVSGVRADEPPAAAAAPEVAPEPSALSKFADRLGLSIGLGTFGELFPYSSVNVPGTSRGEISMFGGARFWLGTQLPGWWRLLGVLEFGVAFAGSLPARGADAVLEGAGIEVGFEYFAKVKPFVRFIYDAQVFAVRNSTEGTLSQNAFFVGGGVRIPVNVLSIDVHLSVGQDFAGGIAPGLGFSLSWQY